MVLGRPLSIESYALICLRQSPLGILSGHNQDWKV
jgi:hypothetical protein